MQENRNKGPVKMIQRMKIAHSFLQSVSNLFYFIILSLPMQFYIWLFSKLTPKDGKIAVLSLRVIFDQP